MEYVLSLARFDLLSKLFYDFDLKIKFKLTRIIRSSNHFRFNDCSLPKNLKLRFWKTFAIFFIKLFYTFLIRTRKIKKLCTINNCVQKILGRDVSFHHNPVYRDKLVCQVLFLLSFPNIYC
jgi:hypothetical protein